MLEFFKSLRRLADRDQAGLYVSNETLIDLQEEAGKPYDKIIAFFKRFAESRDVHFKQDVSGIHLVRYAHDL